MTSFDEAGGPAIDALTLRVLMADAQESDLLFDR
jgi:hypothetical protein